MNYDDLKEAACRAMLDAGFVSPEAFAGDRTVYGHVERVELVVSGLCPCGLGQSRMALTWLPGHMPRPEHIYEKIKASGLKHIDEDRAAGRWTD